MGKVPWLVRRRSSLQPLLPGMPGGAAQWTLFAEQLVIPACVQSRAQRTLWAPPEGDDAGHAGRVVERQRAWLLRCLLPLPHGCARLAAAAGRTAAPSGWAASMVCMVCRRACAQGLHGHKQRLPASSPAGPCSHRLLWRAGPPLWREPRRRPGIPALQGGRMPPELLLRACAGRAARAYGARLPACLLGRAVLCLLARPARNQPSAR